MSEIRAIETKQDAIDYLEDSFFRVIETDKFSWVLEYQDEIQKLTSDKDLIKFAQDQKEYTEQ